jgi:hypothetical protein
MTRRLIDLPGLKDLEYRALMNPRYAEPDARSQYGDIDRCSLAVFGLTADTADATPRPVDWDKIDLKPIAQQVEAFAREGWDVTDDRRRPLRMLSHFNVQLWLALRGVAGALPFAPVDDEAPSGWAAALQADATKFKRDRR